MKATLLFVLLAALSFAGLEAQESAETPTDALNRGTPLGSAKGFLDAASQQDFETAARYLDLRNVPRDVIDLGGPELARQLNFVLSRSIWFDDYLLDDTPSGKQGDGLPDYQDELARIPGSEGDVTLYLQQAPREDQALVWKIANRSVAEVPALYAHYANPPWVEFVRTRLPQDAAFLGLELYKWVIALGIALIAWPILYLLGVGLSRLFMRRENPMYPLLRRVMTGPLVLLSILILSSFVLRKLGLGAVAQKYADAKTLIIVAVIWTLWAIIGLIQRYKRERLIQQGRDGAARLLRPVSNLIRLLVLLAGFLFWLSNLGVNISTVLAGLGVGGLALALALQRPIEDLMGALTLYSQQPVRVGDFCKYGDITGVVEEIGLRTTRIRTLGNTMVCVPNSKIAHSEIENYSARNMIQYKPELRLRYDSSPKQIRGIIDDIKCMLEEHARVLKDIIRVRFTNFESDAILIKVHCYVNSTEVSEFLEIAEELNLKIMEIVDAHSASFALPGRMIYGGQGPQAQGA